MISCLDYCTSFSDGFLASTLGAHSSFSTKEPESDHVTTPLTAPPSPPPHLTVSHFLPVAPTSCSDLPSLPSRLSHCSGPCVTQPDRGRSHLRAFALAIPFAWNVLPPCGHVICCLTSSRSLMKCPPLGSLSQITQYLTATPPQSHHPLSSFSVLFSFRALHHLLKYCEAYFLKISSPLQACKLSGGSQISMPLVSAPVSQGPVT